MFDGNLWIITRRKKTNTESRIRLLDIPKRIIEKYADQRLDNHVFYMPCNCHCNDILREIGKQCGIKNKLTFHLARHTFATTITLSQGMPIETVSRLLGHTNIKTTQIYAKITNEKISRDMSGAYRAFGRQIPTGGVTALWPLCALRDLWRIPKGATRGHGACGPSVLFHRLPY